MAAVAPKVGVFGGAFDPPHSATSRSPRRASSTSPSIGCSCVVVEDPAHKAVPTQPASGCGWPSSRSSRSAAWRSSSTRARARSTRSRRSRSTDPVFLVGADEFAVVPHVEGAGRGCSSSRGSASRRDRASTARGSTPSWQLSTTPSVSRSSRSSRCPFPPPRSAHGSRRASRSTVSSRRGRRGDRGVRPIPPR